MKPPDTVPPWPARMLHAVIRHAYPRSVRARFGREMEQLFIDSYREMRGSPRVRFYARTLWDLVVNGVYARLDSRNARRERRRSLRGRERMALAASMIYDLRFTVRSLGGRPGFTLAAITTLGLGIGASTAVFSVVHGVLFKPLPYPEPDRLVGVFSVDSMLMGPNPSNAEVAGWYAVPPHRYRIWQDHGPFESIGGYEITTLTITGGERPERVEATRATAGVFATLGIAPLLGRAFHLEEDRVGAPRLAVLSYGFWERRFAADPGILGQQLVVAGIPHTVVGVMPAGFSFPGDDQQVYVTFDDERKTATYGFLQVIGRLQPDIGVSHAQLEMNALARSVGEANPDEKDIGYRLIPRREMVVGRTRSGLWMLFGAVGAVLLIACANIASLLLIRSTERRRELALRQALGAGRARLLVQVLGESVLLSVIGGALGSVVAVFIVGPFVASVPGGLPRASEIGVDVRMLLFSFLLSVAAGVVIGALPALRSANAAPGDAMRDAGCGSAGGRRQNRAQTALVVMEIALAFMLVVGAGLFVRSFARLTAVDRGFSSANVLAMPVALPEPYRSSDDAIRAFFHELIDVLEALPGVRTVGSASQMPFAGGWSVPPGFVETSEGAVEARFHITWVSPGYLEAMRIPLVRGRSLSPTDRDGTTPVTVVSQTLARRYWPGENPLGRRLRHDLDGPDSPWYTVVGVVGDVRYRLNMEPMAQAYVPFAQQPTWYQNVVIQTAGDPGGVMPDVLGAVRRIDPDLPVSPRRLDDTIRRSRAMVRGRFAILLVGSLGGTAALLATLGIYSVLAYTVAQRTREIGIRMALGAAQMTVVREVLRRGLALAGTGLGLGVIGAMVTMRFVRTLLFEVDPTDPTTLSAVALLISTVTIAASYIPARRATRVDPVEALRQQ
jgi:putative ABC transport system permease protein